MTEPPTSSRQTRTPSAPTLTLILLMCVAQLLTMLSMSIYAAQLPHLSALWSLNNTEAGWIGAAYFVGYTIAVPILTALTDRTDPKRIYLVGAALLILGNLGFGALAQGFMSAAFFHAVAGAGLAGAYMPGLKGLIDHLDEIHHSRASAFYTASFGLGAAISYPFSAYLGDWFGWPFAFYGVAVSAFLAGLLILFFLPRAKPEHLNQATTHLLDFRPVLRNRAALAYTLAYAIHCWELFAMRTWIVAYLVYAERLHGMETWLFAPAIIAFIFSLAGVPASILGNETAMRIGRRLYVILVMLGSALVCGTIGLTAQVSYALVAIFAIVHGITAILDSASITAGALGNATPGYRGATMAVHSTLGFAGATLGPLVFGVFLDLGGGQTPLGWWAGFAHIGVMLVIGAILLAVLRPPSIPGDRY